MTKLLFIIVLLLISNFINANGILNGSNWKLFISDNGTIENLIINGNDTIKFFKGEKNGPVFYIASKRDDLFKNILQNESIGKWSKIDDFKYFTKVNDLSCILKYKNIDDRLALDITIKNEGNTIVQPFKAGIKLGVDTYMDEFPKWLDALFPTLLRNEKTHFWGYLMSPKRKILVLTSPDPIASWSLDYNYITPKDENGDTLFWGMHRIEGVNIDLLNSLPLPQRCPQNLYQLYPDESVSYRLFLTSVNDISDIHEEVCHNTGAGVWYLPQTSFAVGETAEIKLYSPKEPEVYLDEKKIYMKNIGGNLWSFEFKAYTPGHFVLKGMVDDKISEAIVSVRHPWDWYLNQARKEAKRCAQKASTHIESWYRYTSAFIAARYMPDEDIDNEHKLRFDYLYDLLHKDDIPQIIPYRVQNTSGTIDLLVLKYKAHKDIKDLEKASKLADWLIKYSQRKNGAFKNFLTTDKTEEKGILYTSVLYIAKSMLDLALLEKEVSQFDSKWKKNYKRHFASAKLAIDHLVSMHGNIQTEGEMTYEDGMISCTALQIAYLALQDESSEKEKNIYTKEVLDLLKGHDCLTHLYIPDGRQRGGTLRFWESQYDVQTSPNFMNSPHGWSAWRGYATYYTYLLTGDERWLQESYNAAGAFAQLIDYKTGTLRWAFCSNPFVPAQMISVPHPTASLDSITELNLNPMTYPSNAFVLGEQYINMVSNRMFFNTQDNDVHECFKYIGESFLTNAFVVERENGEFKGYNCKVVRKNNVLEVIPNEKLINKIHFNLNGQKNVKIIYNHKILGKKVSGMSWVNI